MPRLADSDAGTGYVAAVALGHRDQVRVRARVWPDVDVKVTRMLGEREATCRVDRPSSLDQAGGIGIRKRAGLEAQAHGKAAQRGDHALDGGEDVGARASAAYVHPARAQVLK
jgi:hypothetical protein